jgi:hypothetical protein
MKKLGFFLCLLVIALTSCDHAYSIDYKLSNSSGHAVTFTSNMYNDFWKNYPDGITIEPRQDTIYLIHEGLGSAHLYKAKDYLLSVYEVYGDTITFTFDDGRYLKYTKEVGNGPFDFEGDHYIWTTERNQGFLNSWDYYGCLTYTITEEDYANSIEP